MIALSVPSPLLITAVGCFFGGLLIRRLWPAGCAFVLMWSSVVSEIAFRSLSDSGAKIGKAFSVAPLWAVKNFAEHLAVGTAIFLIAFGIAKLVRGRRLIESGPPENA